MSYAINTVVEFEATAVSLRTIMTDPEVIKSLERAVKTAQKTGMPNSNEYSLTSITASSADDLNLKMYLAIAPLMLQVENQTIELTDTLEELSPLMDAILKKIMENAKFGDPVAGIDDIDYPVTITV
tara:strand:+ start:23308 stop:23688 length:381 start_codon:yes stop_codon:yes gene_type:complete